MNIKLTVIGSTRNINIISNVINKSYPDIDVTNHKNSRIKKNLVNSFLSLESSKNIRTVYFFTGRIPYEIMNNMMISKKPWVYISLDNSQLLRILLQASFIHQYDIRNISIDSYKAKWITNAYTEIGLKKEELNIYKGSTDIYALTLLKI